MTPAMHLAAGAVTGVGRDGSCVEAITLATNFKTAPRSDGLAFSRPTIADAIVEAADDAPDRNLLRSAVAPLFRAAAGNSRPPRDGHDEIGSKVLALGRTDKFAVEDVRIAAVFRDSRSPVLYIEAERRFPGLPSDVVADALSYRGWFRRDASRSDAPVPIDATLSTFSTAEGSLPRYSPIGIVRTGGRSIWVMSEWGIESQTIVLFDVSVKGVRRLVAAAVSGC